MSCLIVSIGDELLIGQTINTNAAWMGKELNKIGVLVTEVLTISDTKEAITKMLEKAIGSYDVILVTGGLGPTKDDITKKTIADFFNVELIENKEALDNVYAFFESFNRPVLPVNRLQAQVPANSEVLTNKVGTAPGMLFREQGTIMLSMPGVPSEMRFLMKEYLLPLLKKELDLPTIFHHTIMTQGMGESFIAEKIQTIEDTLPSDVKLAYLPSPGLVKLRLTGISENGSDIENEVLQIGEKIERELPPIVFGYNDVKLEAVVAERLKELGQTVATAESCSGGTIAATLTSIAGSSAYFMGGVVAYANEVKQGLLGVSKEDLANYGAVSEQVVTQMANGIKAKMGTDYGIATSGIAGPDGGTVDKPVGTVYIAVAGPEGTLAKRYDMGQPRNRVVLKTKLAALNMLRKAIL